MKNNNNVFVILTDKQGGITYQGIQIDGGTAARQVARDKGYKMQIWDMGSRTHLYEMSEEAREEIRTAWRKAKETRRATA